MTKRFLKILLLDDSVENIYLIERELKREELHCTIISVANKIDFISAMLDFDPDVVLSDNFLLEFNAIEALSLSRVLNGKIPFILLNGGVGEDSTRKFLELGGDGYLAKDALADLAKVILITLDKYKITNEYL